MTRTIVDIPAAQLVEIDRLCKLMGISRAEAVRRALATFADGHIDVTPEAFGLWSSRGARVDPAEGKAQGAANDAAKDAANGPAQGADRAARSDVSALRRSRRR